MAQQTINVGASANDGTGTPLRTAFQFTNSNFSELYSAIDNGFAIPRLTTAQRNALTPGVGDKGKMVYDTTLTTLCLWNGTAWEFVSDTSNGWVSVLDFGAKGDGVTDDTAALQAALNSGKPLFWAGLTYRITSPLTQTATGNVFWEGVNATILYDGAHTESAITLTTPGIEIVINNMTIDGSKLCNKCLEINNNTDSSSNFTGNGLFVKRAKRINTFNGGDGIQIRGLFKVVTFNGGGVSDCELPAGQGTFGSVGISGITVTWYTTTRFVSELILNGVRIEKIYSSDLAYQFDQDGVKYFVPNATVGTVKVQGLFTCIGSEFINCYGRSIKTQCRDTVVTSSSFTRTEGLTSGVGNPEVDAQNGNGNFRDLNFDYSNGQKPEACLNVSGSIGTPGLLADGCSVVCDAGTTLSIFAQVFPSNGTFSRHVVSNNKVYATVTKLFEYLCNGNKNYAEVSNNYVQSIALGETSERALIYVRSSGLTTPRFAYVTAFGNVYADTNLPSLVRDGVSGTVMASNLSAWGNYGFETNGVTNPVASGLKSNAISRLQKVGPFEGGSYLQLENLSIASGATATFKTPNNSQTGIVFINSNFGSTGYAIFANSSTTNTVISKGASFEIGNAASPGIGTFRVWSSATNEISIENTNASTRSFGIFVMVNG
jgi:hypothetical protein